MEAFLRVGVITSPHGVKGEVKVFPTTDDVSRFKKLGKVTVQGKRRSLETEVEGVKFFKQMVILKLRGIDNMDEAETLRQADIMVDREHAVALGPNENFIADVIGLSVVGDDGRSYGVVKDILKTGANDVYVVENGEKELLLPSIPSCILEVKPEEGFVRVHMLPGLLDL